MAVKADCLVTGGCGFIGSHLVRRLLADGAEVVIVDDLSAPAAVVPPAQPRLTYLWGDIATLIPDVEAPVIYHLAALRSVPRSVSDPLATIRVNVDGTAKVFELARRTQARVVYASSSSVYGPGAPLPMREDAPLNPASPYAASKASMELLALSYGRCYGLRSVGLRYFNVYGPGQDPVSEYAAVIPKFILASLRGEPLEIHGDGEQSRDFTYVDDVVDATVKAGRFPLKASEAAVFNVGGGDDWTINEVADAVECATGSPFNRITRPSRAGDVSWTRADPQAASNALGWVPRWSFREGIAGTVEAFRGSA